MYSHVPCHENTPQGSVSILLLWQFRIGTFSSMTLKRAQTHLQSKWKKLLLFLRNSILVYQSHVYLLFSLLSLKQLSHQALLGSSPSRLGSRSLFHKAHWRIHHRGPCLSDLLPTGSLGSHLETAWSVVKIYISWSYLFKTRLVLTSYCRLYNHVVLIVEETSAGT